MCTNFKSDMFLADSHHTNYLTFLQRRANEAGLHHCSQEEYCAAFECFTEAISLHPASPVYHCNRAHAALKLKMIQIAATDAELSLSNT